MLAALDQVGEIECGSIGVTPPERRARQTSHQSDRVPGCTIAV
jgi:hypothetical protein